MLSRRHEVPTHLNVEDKLVLGLTPRQAAYLLAGVAGGAALWQSLAAAPAGLRLGVAAACVLVAVALTWVRPLGRALDEWAFAVAHHAATPKACAWRPRPAGAGARPRPGGAGRAGWAELAPSVRWSAAPALGAHSTHGARGTADDRRPPGNTEAVPTAPGVSHGLLRAWPAGARP